MNNKILNFNPQFQYSKEKNEFVLKNVDDKHDWLISLLPKQKCRNVYIVPPKKNNAYDFLPEKTSDKTIVIVLINLHEYGIFNIEYTRAQELYVEAKQIESKLKLSGGGKVFVMISNDEFKKFPVSLYSKFQGVFRLGFMIQK